MNRSWRREWPHWVLLVGIFAAAAIVWPRVPERMPVHWGIDGTADRYGGRVEGLLLLPILALVLYVVLLVLPRFDPRGANYAQFAGPYALIRLATLVLLAGIYGVIIAAALGSPLNMTRVVVPAVGLLLIVLGSVMGKLRPAWFVGIRTPWTLTSARSWGKTHRLGGWIFIVAGLVLILAGLLNLPVLLIGALAGLGLALVGLWLYSYLVWRDDNGAHHPAGIRPTDPGRS
jgi:uncharacterized membrane protein